MRNVEYITNGFGQMIQPAPVSPDGGLLQRAGLDSSFAPAFRATINQRGVAGIDQAINFFSRYDQSMQALYTQIEAQKSPLGGKRGKDAAYEMVRRTFNAIASQVGTNPLINAYTKATLADISRSQAEEFKFLMAFIGEYLTTALRRLRNSL